MQRTILPQIFGLLFLLALAPNIGEALGQTNFDLEPPMQADTNSHEVLMSTDPSAIPVFRFATAEIADDKVTVSTAAAKQKLIASLPGSSNVDPKIDPRGIQYTENETQTYTVMVPYTEKVGDERVTRTRAETRTRMVPVTRYRKRNAEEQAEFEEAVEAKKKEDARKSAEKKEPEIEAATMEMVQTSYTVNIRFTETVDGVALPRMRQETRTRMMQVMRGKTETTPELTSLQYSIEDVKAFSVTGEELDIDTFKVRVSERSPVILINDPKAISPYFETILKPESIFLMCPDKEKP